MRYENWDILLFPQNDHVPLKEFKTACCVVPDLERGHSLGSFGLPTVTTFVPGLLSGTPFTVSILSWGPPGVSQATKAYSNHHELVMFEIRIFIDGRMVRSAVLDRNAVWPVTIHHTCEITKNGDLELLKFPSFHEEVLYENPWRADDDLGRIKVLISEGFPRDSPTMPIERVKNVVSFSFQHAPLEILESSSIAWPNTSMWFPIAASNISVPTYYPASGTGPHSHHRHHQQEAATGNDWSQPGLAPITTFPLSTELRADDAIQPQGHPQSNAKCDAATSTVIRDLASCKDAHPNDRIYSVACSSPGDANHRHVSHVSSNLSFPEYALSHHNRQPYLFPNATIVPERPVKPSQPVVEVDGQSDLLSIRDRLDVPNNTPAMAPGYHAVSACTFYAQAHGIAIPFNDASANSLPDHTAPSSAQVHTIPLPAPEVISRKEGHVEQDNPELATTSVPSRATQTDDIVQVRKASEAVSGLGERTNMVDFGPPFSQTPQGQCPSSQNCQRSVSGVSFNVDTENQALGPSGTGVKSVRKFTPVSTQEALGGDNRVLNPLI